MAFLFVSLMVGFSNAGDIQRVTDNFYGGLADIIENNMNDPDACVAGVNDYYASNQAAVQQIREGVRKGMEYAMSQMESYEDMTEEDLARLEEMAEQKGESQNTTSAETTRYTKTLQSFLMKHPMHGARVAGKAMELMPEFAMGGAGKSGQFPSEFNIDQ